MSQYDDDQKTMIFCVKCRTPVIKKDAKYNPELQKWVCNKCMD